MVRVELVLWECVTRGKSGAEGMCKGLGEMFGEKTQPNLWEIWIQTHIS